MEPPLALACRVRRAVVSAVAPLALGLLAGLLALTFPAPAGAADDDPELLIQQGIQLRRENDNEGAIKVFTKAYKIKRTPRAAAHLGLAEYRLSRWLDAEGHLSEALRAQGDAWIERQRPELRKSLDEVRTQLGWLEVMGRPTGAEVEVAGRVVGKLPFTEPLRVAIGEVHLRVTMDGYEADRRSVVIRAGETTRAVLELEKREEAVEIPPKPTTIGTPVGSGTPAIEVRTASDRDAWRRPAAWVSAGVATLLVGSGIAATVVQSNKISAFDARKKPDGSAECSTSATNNGGTECTSLLAESKFAQKLAIGSFVGGGVAAILSAVFFLTAPTPTEQLAAACTPVVSPGGAGATCPWRF